MSWYYVSSRQLQTGQLYGLWLTTRGVSSTDELVRWLTSKGWRDMTIWAHETLPTGAAVKEMHGVWTGRDGVELPQSDDRALYGPLYISELRSEDPGAVSRRAPGEKPPPSAEVLAAMYPETPKAGRWKLPVVLGVATMAFLTLIRGKPGAPTPTPPAA